MWGYPVLLFFKMEERKLIGGFFFCLNVARLSGYDRSISVWRVGVRVRGFHLVLLNLGQILGPSREKGFINQP